MNWLSSWSHTNDDDKRQAVEQLHWLSWNGPRMMRVQYRAMLEQIVGSFGVPRGVRIAEEFQGNAILISINDRIVIYNALRQILGIRLASDISTPLNGYDLSNVLSLTPIANNLKNISSMTIDFDYRFDKTAESSHNSTIISGMRVNGIRARISIIINNKTSILTSLSGSNLGLSRYQPYIAPFYESKEECTSWVKGIDGRNRCNGYTTVIRRNPGQPEIIRTGKFSVSIIFASTVSIFRYASFEINTQGFTPTFPFGTWTPPTLTVLSQEGLNDQLYISNTIALIDTYTLFLNNFKNFIGFSQGENKPVNVNVDRDNALIINDTSTDILNSLYISYLGSLYSSLLPFIRSLLSLMLIFSLIGKNQPVAESVINENITIANSLSTTFSLSNLSRINDIYNTVLKEYTNSATNAIEGFKTIYENSRRYILDDDLLPPTITFKNTIYQSGSYNINELSGIFRDITSTLIRKYASTTNTQIPTSDSITPTTTISNINTLYRKYLGDGPGSATPVPLWVAYENTLRSNIQTAMNDYQRIRSELPAGSSSLFSDATIATDLSNIDAAKIVRVPVSGSTNSFEFGVEYGPIPIFTAPTNDSSYTGSTDTNTTYTFTPASKITSPVNLYGINTTGPVSLTGWGGTTTFYTVGTVSNLRAIIPNVINPKYAGTASSVIPSSRSIVIQLPSAQTVDMISYVLGPNQTSTQPTLNVSVGSITVGQNSVNSSTSAARITAPTTTFNSSIANTVFRNVGGNNVPATSSVSGSAYFISFTKAANDTSTAFNIGGITLYNGVGYARRVSTAIDYLNGILSKYKSVVDSVLGEIRTPATASLTRFRDMYRKLTNCIPPGIETNAVYAPTVAANRDLATDETAIGSMFTRSAGSTMTQKYTTAIISAFNALRTDEITFLQAYKALYDAYFNIQGQMPGFATLPTADIADNGSARITALQAIPALAAGTLPTDAAVDGLAAICTSYNGENGLYAKLLMHIRTNATTAIQAFEGFYAVMPDFIKTAIGYQSVLVGGQIPDARAASALTDLKTNYDILAGVVMSSAYTTYMSYRLYLTSTDITTAMTSYIAKCEVYEPQTTFILLSGDTYGALIQDGIDFIDTFSSVLVGRYKKLYASMQSRNIPVDGAELPTTIDADALVKGAAAWGVIDAYVSRFEQLVGKFQTAVVAKVDAAVAAAAVSNATQQIASSTRQGSMASINSAKNLLATAKAPVAALAPSSGAARIQQISTKVVQSSKGIASVPTGGSTGASNLGGAAAAPKKNVAAVIGEAATKVVAKTPTSASRGAAASQGQGQGAAGASQGQGQGAAGASQGASQGAGASQGQGQGAAGGAGGSQGQGQGAAGASQGQASRPPGSAGESQGLGK